MMARIILSSLLFCFVATCCYADLLPAVVWDPTNPMFACDNPEIQVRIGDKLNVVCPNRGVNTQNRNDFASTSTLYEAVSLLYPTQKTEYERCDSNAAKPILKCNQPNSLKFSTISFKRYASSSSQPVFQEGYTYYLLATSYRYQNMLDNKIGGSCNRKVADENYLKLKIRVCTYDEIHVYKNCSVCSTSDCYAKACMTCGPKVQFPPNNLLKVGKKCFAVAEEQQCLHKKTNKAQKFQTMQEYPCDTNSVGIPILPSGGKTSASSSGRTADDNSSKTTIIYIAVGTCLACFVGGILLGLLIMKRKQRMTTQGENRKSQKQAKPSAKVSFTNGGFVTKESSLEIKPATIGSPSKVYGNFEY